MATISHFDVVDYPYDGVFYTVSQDESLPLTERRDVETIVLETKCDIQEVSKAANPALIATFSVDNNVLFPQNGMEKGTTEGGLQS